MKVQERHGGEGMGSQQSGIRKQEVEIMPWFISAADDGLKKDCIMVAMMCGSEIQSISLHVAEKAEEL